MGIRFNISCIYTLVNKKIKDGLAVQLKLCETIYHQSFQQ